MPGGVSATFLPPISKFIGMDLKHKQKAGSGPSLTAGTKPAAVCFASLTASLPLAERAAKRSPSMASFSNMSNVNWAHFFSRVRCV